MKHANKKGCSNYILVFLLLAGLALGGISITGLLLTRETSLRAVPANYGIFAAAEPQTAPVAQNNEQNHAEIAIDYGEFSAPVPEEMQTEADVEPIPAPAPENYSAKAASLPEQYTEPVAKSTPKTAKAVPQAGSQSGFVYANGTDFYINGKPFYFSGTNNYYLRYGDRHCIAYDVNSGCTREVLDDAVNMNLTVIRTWGFTDGGYYWGSLQPQMGVFDEANFVKLDYLIKEAGERNLKLIFPLVNNWAEYGGMCAYNGWCGLSSEGCNPNIAESSHDEFYNSTCTRDAFKDYVSYVLNRVNTFTGVAYKDDPTIFAWELANEPRAKSDTSGGLLDEWVGEMSGYIKSIDANHMVTTGSEGFYSGEEGVDFIRNHNHSSIDYASMHLYPDYWSMTKQESNDWITNHVNDSHNILGKPIVLGEFGKKVSGQEAYMQDWYSLLESSKINGNMFWQLIDHNYIYGDGFEVNYPEDSAMVSIIASNSGYMKDYTEQLSPSNNAPQISASGDIVVLEGDTVDIDVTASDAGGDYIFLSISDAYHFDRDTEGFSWQTYPGDRGVYTVTITASDGISETSIDYTLTVLENDVCVVPADGMVLTFNTTLCTGNYHLPNGLSVGSGVTLDCDGSPIYGDRAGYGITFSGANSTIRNCKIEDYRMGVQTIGSYNLTIENNEFNSYLYHGVNIRGGAKNTIRNNTFLSNYDIGAYAYQSSSNTIEKNSFRNNGKGIYFDKCSFSNVKDNNFYNNKAGAVHITSGSTYNNVTGNYMNRDGYTWTQGGGIRLIGSVRNIIENNIMNDTYVPFYSSSSSFNRINNNTIMHGPGYVNFYYSFYNNFTSNTITNAQGIRVRIGGENRFEFNSIHDNSMGMSLEDTYAVIEYNNIYDNSAFDLEVKSGNYSAENNWWGTQECNIIASQIDDCFDSPLYACVDWEPVLNSSYPDGTSTACIDSIPPGKVYNLFSFKKGDDWINWEWHNPNSYDFDYSIIYIDGVNVANTSDDFYTANGLITNTTHTITINTVDTRGNINTDNVSSTVVIGTLPADLVIKSAEVYTKDPEAGKWTSFGITIENTGIGTASMIEWMFESGMPGENLTFGEFTVEPGKTVDIYPAFKYNSSGDYSAVFTIDPGNKVYETDDSNNNVAIPVTIA